MDMGAETGSPDGFEGRREWGSKWEPHGQLPRAVVTVSEGAHVPCGAPQGCWPQVGAGITEGAEAMHLAQQSESPGLSKPQFPRL